MYLRVTLAIFTLLIITACTPAVRNPAPLSTAAVPASVKPEEYRIHTGDQLDIRFFFNPEMNQPVVVRPDGRISLQLLGEMMVTELTPLQLTEQLRAMYGKEIAKPEITVIVRAFNAQKVFVNGEVNKAGLVGLSDEMTVLQAISQAGGFKEEARHDEVIVLRATADKKVVPFMVNLERAIDGSDTAQDMRLQPNDIVYVPRSHIANINKWIDEYIRKNIPLPIGFGFGLN